MCRFRAQEVRDHRTKKAYNSLDHYWSSDRKDNFITATTEGKKSAKQAKYRFVRKDGYVLKSPSNKEGTSKPLYLYYNTTRKDNFTTASPEGIKAAIRGGYKMVRIEGYVLKTVKPEFKHLYKPLWLYYHDKRKDNFTIASPKGISTAVAGGYRKSKNRRIC